jgi:hypothetical protein
MNVGVPTIESTESAIPNQHAFGVEDSEAQPDYSERAIIRRYEKPLTLTRVPDCGHKFVPEQEPRHRNCESCWFTFFQVHGELTKTADELFQAHGPEIIAQLRGKKFTKHFLRFMGALAQWKATADAASEKTADEQGISGTVSNDSVLNTGNDEYIEQKRKELLHSLDGGINPLGGGSVAD